MVAGLSARSAAGPGLGAEPGRAVASGSEACASRPPVTEVTESGNPIRRSGADVCPVPTRIVLSYLTLWAQRSSHKLSFLEGPARWAPTDDSQRGRCCHLYRGLAVVTCLEVRWPPGLLV